MNNGVEDSLMPTEVASLGIRHPQDEKPREDNKSRIDPIVRSSSREATESTDDTPSLAAAIDTDKMTEQLRMVYKEVAESRTEKDTDALSLALGEPPHPADIDPNDYEVYRKAMQYVPKYISGFGLQCQVAISEVLNVERDDYKDYRLVADSLGLPTTSINVVEDMPNQMMKVFKQCGSKFGRDFVDAAYQWGRFDALRVLVSYFDKGSLSPSLSMEEPPKLLQKQRNLSSSFNEGMLRRQREIVSEEESFLQSRSGSLRASPVQYDVTPHEDNAQQDDEEGWEKTDLEFWNSIKGIPQFKQLKDVKKKFEKLLAGDSEFSSKFGYTWKLIVHTLKLDYSAGGSQIVTSENFRRMLAYLGSTATDDNCCLRRAYDLMKKSMRKVKQRNETLNVSWFAGHMIAEEANERLASCDRGTYLVRFSTGEADRGWYVISIKTESRGVFEFRVEQFQEKGIRKFRLNEDRRDFASLTDLISHFETREMIKEKEEGIAEFLKKPCPNLPLNEICKGYKKSRGARR